MKKNYPIKKMLFLLAGVVFTLAASSQDSLVIRTGDLVLNPDTLYEVTAEFYDSKNDSWTSDVKINWHTDPGYLGKVNKNGFLKTHHPGEGFLFAKYKGLKDSVSLVVNGTIKEDDEDDPEVDYPKVKIVPGSIKVEISDSVELHAFYIDTSGVKIDTSFTWTVEPVDPYIGEFKDSTNGIFYSADTKGEGIIIATLGALADTAKIKVYESRSKREKKEKERNKENNRGKLLTIEPGDMMVYTGHDPIAYSAEFRNNGQKFQNAEFSWSVSDTSVATIENDGLLTLSGNTGMTLVHAQYDKYKASVELLVVDSTVDLEINTISIRKVLPNGDELKVKILKEGDSYKIGGLPYPLNLLNAGKLHFPFGCINEDIDIYMFIPEEYAETCDTCTKVKFNSDIITGVQFNVKPVVSDTIIEPYYFNVPVNLSLVFKHELLDSLGVTPEELDVFFADNTGFEEVGGVVAVDTVKNKIYANIIHFSTIVVKQNDSKTAVNDQVPVQEGELEIYPNPSTGIAHIQFSVSTPGEVRIVVYNLFGQQVQVLADRSYEKGVHKTTWSGNDMNGAPATSGVYLCSYVKEGKVSQVKKLILNR